MIVLLLLALAQDPPNEPLPAHLRDEEPPKVRFAEVKTTLWFASLEGSGALEKAFGVKRSGDDNGPRMSFQREGRLDGSAPVVGLELTGIGQKAGSPAGGLRLSGWYGKWSESGTLDTPLTFGSTTASAGSHFRSEMSLYYIGFDGVLLLTARSVPLEFTAWGGLKVWHAEFKMFIPPGELGDGGGSVSPGVGARLEYRPLSFLYASVQASISGGIGVPEEQLILSVGAAYSSHLRVEAGYHHFWANWDVTSEVVFRLSIGGPYVGVSYRF